MPNANSKSEIRNPKQIQNPKQQFPKRPHGACFGFRRSDLFRISNFEFCLSRLDLFGLDFDLRAAFGFRIGSRLFMLRRLGRAHAHCLALVKPGDDECRILAAEAHVVAQHMAARLLTGLIWNLIQIAVGIRRVIVDRWRQRPVAKHQQTNGQLDRAASRRRMTEHALGAGDRRAAGVRA